MKTYFRKYYKKIKTGGKMKRIHFLLFTVCCLLLAVFLWGCGSGPGSPGSTGSEDTGIIVDAQVIGRYQDTDGIYSVDAFQNVCSEGPPPVLEFFADHQARVTFTARLVNPSTTFQIGNLYIDKYTVEFRRSTDSIGAPPIESDKRFKTITITAPVGSGTTTLTDTLILVDLIRKVQYSNDMLSGRYGSGPTFINNYTAIFTFYGKNDFGKEFKIKTQMDFQIGDFDVC